MTAALSSLRCRVAIGLALLCLLLPATGAIASPAGTALWDEEGELVLGGITDTYPGMFSRHSVGTTICSDGEGGLIGAAITGDWLVTPFDLRIQRLDYLGNMMWNDPNGLVLTGWMASATGPPHVVSDRNGGAWVAWADDRGAAPGVYVQRVDHDGSFIFSANGLRVSDGDADSQGNDDVDVEVTNSGKLLLAYWDGGLRLQRVALDGTLEWGTGGIAVTTDTGHGRLDLAVWGEAAVVVWESGRAGQAGATSIFANRVDAAGATLWGADGVLVFSAAGVTPDVTHTVWDGNSVFVSWEQNRSVWFDIHAQRLDASGVPQWGSTGTGRTVLYAMDTPYDETGEGSRPLPQIVGDEAGGCVIAWEDGRDYDNGTSPTFHREDIYAQRLAADGTALWTTNGEPLYTMNGRQIDVRLIPDGAHGAIVAFADFLDVDFDITALRVDASGTRLWYKWISSVWGDNGGDYEPVVAPDDAHGLLCGWRRDDGGNDFYGTHRTLDGSMFTPRITVTAPNGGELLMSRQTFEITWTTTIGGDVRIEYSKGSGTRTTVVASTANDGAYAWTVPDDPSSQVKVHVSDAADGSPADSSDAYFTICAGLAAGATDYGADVAVADVDRDGVLDLLAVHRSTSPFNLYVLPGRGSGGVGDGTFGHPAGYLVGAAGNALTTGDFNEDGYMDVAVATKTGLRVLLGTAAGGFGLAVPYASGGAFSDVLSADFDEDGIADLAAAGGDSVAVLLGGGSGGKGSGLFAAAVRFGAGTGASHLAAGDFDEDGRLDLAVTDNGSAGVSVLLGNGSGPVGDGTFAAPASYAAGAGPWGLATGDFDEDGILDLAVANADDHSLSVLLGNGSGGTGDGTFAPPVTYSFTKPALVPRNLVVADSDGDGIADLLMACQEVDAHGSTMGGVALLRGGGTGGAGDGTFGSPILYRSGDAPEAVVVSDFDEDGACDAAVVNSGDLDDNLTVMLAGDCGLGLSPAVEVVAPNGGESWQVGDEETFSWTRGAGVIAVNLDLSRDGGLIWETVATNLTGTSWAWTVTDPPTTTALARIYDPTAPQRTDAGDATFVVWAAGVDVLPGVPARAAFTPGRPNPFRDEVRFVLAAPRAARVRVGVYDLAGRCVRTLLEGELGAGEHPVAWDGRDATGAEAGTGVYFVRARWGDFEAVRRTVRIR